MPFRISLFPPGCIVTMSDSDPRRSPIGVRALEPFLTSLSQGSNGDQINHNLAIRFSRLPENRVKILRFSGFPYGMVVHIITIGGSGATITEGQWKLFLL